MIGSAIAGIISTIIGKGVGIVDQYVEDKDQAAKLKAQLEAEMLKFANDEMNAKADIIKAEAQSDHKLAAIWRPLLMVVIIFIVANNYILAPYAEAIFGVSSLSLDLPEKLWNLMTIGVGGYLTGRSGEKIMREFKKNK